MTDLLDLPHIEAAARAGEGAPAFLFVNPVEYHGPHLSLHNDRHISVGLARRLAAAESYADALSGDIEPPKPILRWTLPLSLGGRIVPNGRIPNDRNMPVP
jgi:hypothetical protein